MKHLIADIAKALVDRPDKVSVTEIEGNNTNVLELNVAKSGRNAYAIRTIVNAASGKTRKRYVLEIID